MDSDDDESNNNNNRNTPPAGDILYDTLYRYMVLFDFPSDTENGINNSSGFGNITDQTYWCGNPVWNVLLDCLLNYQDNNSMKKRRGGRKICERDRVFRQQCRESYMADRAVWGVHVGSHPIMIRYLSYLCFCVLISVNSKHKENTKLFKWA